MLAVSSEVFAQGLSLISAMGLRFGLQSYQGLQVTVACSMVDRVFCLLCAHT